MVMGSHPAQEQTPTLKRSPQRRTTMHQVVSNNQSNTQFTSLNYLLKHRISNSKLRSHLQWFLHSQRLPTSNHITAAIVLLPLMKMDLHHPSCINSPII